MKYWRAEDLGSRFKEARLSVPKIVESNPCLDQPREETMCIENVYTFWILNLILMNCINTYFEIMCKK